MVGAQRGRLYNDSKPPLIVFTDPQEGVIVEQNAELSASQVTTQLRQVLAQESFSSTSATGNPPTTNVSTKAAGAAGFEAIPAVLGILIGANGVAHP